MSLKIVPLADNHSFLLSDTYWHEIGEWKQCRFVWCFYSSLPFWKFVHKQWNKTSSKQLRQRCWNIQSIVVMWIFDWFAGRSLNLQKYKWLFLYFPYQPLLKMFFVVVFWGVLTHQCWELKKKLIIQPFALSGDNRYSTRKKTRNYKCRAAWAHASVKPPAVRFLTF